MNLWMYLCVEYNANTNEEKVAKHQCNVLILSYVYRSTQNVHTNCTGKKRPDYDLICIAEGAFGLQTKKTDTITKENVKRGFD